MTDKQKAFIDRLKRYSENADEYYYSRMVSKMQNDDKFNDLIVAMTLGRAMGRSSLEKFKYDFGYKSNRR